MYYFYSHIKSKMLYNEDSSLGTQQFPVFCLCPSLPFSLSAPLLFLLSFYWLPYYHSCIAACHFAQITAVSPVDGGTLPDWYSVPGTVPSTLPNSGSLSQHFLLSHGFNDDNTGSFYCSAGAARLTPPAGPTVNGELITPNSQGQFVIGFTENSGCLEVYI